MKYFIWILICSTILLNFCTKKNNNKIQEKNVFRVGLVLDKGGKDDKSFNSAAYKGASDAKKDFGIYFKYIECTDDSAFEPNIRTFAEKKFDMIVSLGFAQMEAVSKIAKDYPKTKFAIIDAKVDLPNVASLLFSEHEGSFLVGAIAALKSKTGKIGFVGGMDIPLIRRFELGYKEGVLYVNPKAKIISNFVGVTMDAWNNPTKGKELANSQYDQNVDIIFAAAGASGMGVFDAAEERKKFVIGVDSNQNWIKPGYILTSMLKKVDVAVYSIIKDGKEGHFAGGTKYYHLNNKGVDYALDEYNKNLLSSEILKKIDQIKEDIIFQKIKVSDYYLLKKNKNS
jgi:basic membrane protein A